ncbi:MAG: polymer-forming cytoskeletal protein [Acidobacteria bacterium]|nr:polymer-forming cytoskeletal protein [Acidobacteriota bacterium]
MWGKKDNPPPAPRPLPSAPPVNPLEVTPVASPSIARPSEPAARLVQAHIGKSVIVKGEISGSEDLYVDGEVRGSIELRDHSLTVGPNGKVEANVIAREIVVQGTLNGNVHAGDKIEIRKTGSLLGDLTTARIIIEDGAYFKGSIDISKPGQKTETPRPSLTSATKPPVQPSLQVAGAVEPRKI